jgi:hypothetical protein
MTTFALLEVAGDRRSRSSSLLWRKSSDVYQKAFVAARANPPCIWGGMGVRLIGHVRAPVGRPQYRRSLEQKMQANPGGLLAL